MVAKVNSLGRFLNTVEAFGSDDFDVLAERLSSVGARLAKEKALLANNLDRADSAVDQIAALNARFGNGAPLEPSSTQSSDTGPK